MGGLPMPSDFDTALERYADLIIHTGLNLQPGQRLIIADPSIRFGVPLETLPFIRTLSRAAFSAGARSVDPLWGDSALTLMALEQRGADWVDSFPDWRYRVSADHVRDGGAYLSVHAHPPNLLQGQDEGLAATFQRRTADDFYPTSEVTTRDRTNWCVIAIPGAEWADIVLPDLSPEDRLPGLWDLVLRICRADRSDPAEAWRDHVAQLTLHCDYLNAKAYDALHYTADGTDLTIGLPAGHRWHGGGSTTTSGLAFIPNLPTEEVYTLPDRTRADGEVAASMPLSVGGSIIEDIRLVFKGGRVVESHASLNDALLDSKLGTDDGAARLGEVALVPHSSPVSQSGILFFDTLYDENAACHLALGRAYTSTIEGGASMDESAFMAAGGNVSKIHLDFMIGSDRMDIDGLTADGVSEPVMRAGEWAFDA
jgi:aminopeptidase